MSTTDAHVISMISLGEGGWTAYPERPKDPDKCRHGYTVSISGYGSDWRRYLPTMAPDAPVVDIRAALAAGQYEDAVTFAVSGPMFGPDVPAGHLSTLDGVKRWDRRPEFGRDLRLARLGNARGLDYAAPDVYVAIADRFGIPRTTAAEALANEGWGAR